MGSPPLRLCLPSLGARSQPLSPDPLGFPQQRPTGLRSNSFAGFVETPLLTPQPPPPPGNPAKPGEGDQGSQTSGGVLAHGAQGAENLQLAFMGTWEEVCVHVARP